MTISEQGKLNRNNHFCYYSDLFPEELQAQLAEEEGVRLDTYKDHLGNKTIGIGHNIDADKYWPMDVTSISDKLAWEIFEDDLIDADDELRRKWKHYAKMYAGPRKWAMLAMAFQLGVPRFMQFVQMRAYVERGYWELAAEQALDSQWAKQCPNRAKRVASQIATGQWYSFLN